MQKPTLDIDIKLVVETPNNIIITDNTNYTTLGLNPNDVFMTVQIITPIGLLYSPSYFNTPNISNDLTPSSPFEYKDVDDAIVKFLQDSHSCFINGIYKVNIKWYYVGTGETFEYTLEKDIKLVLPKIKIKQYADCFCAKFRSTDITSYGESVKVDYEHIINYPSETNTPDIETGLSDYTDEQLANGTYVSQISTTRDFNFGTFDVRYTLVGRESFVVDCASLCDVKCGINNLYKKYQEACGKDKHESERLLKMLNKVTLLYTIMTLNNACGTSENSESYISKIKDIIGDCDCGCTGCGEDIWVTGVCGSTGGSEFDPTPIYNYINSINTNITNNLDSINTDITNLETLYNTLLNQSWFAGLVTTCLVGFPTGTDTQKKQYIIDLLCELKTAIQSPPEAHDDYSTIQENTTVEKLVTLNDFFTTDVVVTIVTNGTNGVATVLADGKTLKYIPNTNWFGNDTITYKITDANAQESTAVWHITVTAVPAVSCSAVTANYNADFYTVGDNLQIAINNLSDIGGNVLTAESYQIIIRDSSNSILHSYTQAGTMTAAPTIFTSPIPIEPNWDNFTIEQSITTESSTGALCGTATFERADPYSLTDIGVSWFDGTTPPASFGFDGDDTQVEKKQKFMDAVDGNTTDIALLNTTVDDLLNRVSTLELQLNYVTSQLYVCCDSPPESEAFAGTTVELCTESVQGRITYELTYSGISGLTSISVIQKALLVPTATPDITISSTPSNMIVPSSSDMRNEIADIGNPDNKFRLLMQYTEDDIVKQGYLTFSLPHFELDEDACVGGIVGLFTSLYGE